MQIQARIRDQGKENDKKQRRVVYFKTNSSPRGREYLVHPVAFGLALLALKKAEHHEEIVSQILQYYAVVQQESQQLFGRMQ